MENTIADKVISEFKVAVSGFKILSNNWALLFKCKFVDMYLMYAVNLKGHIE